MNVFELVAKLILDSSEYDEGLKDSEEKSSSFGDKLKTGLAAGAKVAVAGLTAASSAVAGLAAKAVQSYAEFEQLEGGIETLFGDAAPSVMENASAAFRSAGMSINDYMETSIASAAALINSLGGDQARAADLMDMSITDMSDNVNKMGTSMEAVQNAYRGFSRGNFTMLDNLALGFAGTKEGMQELLDKAYEFSGVEYDISSYSDIVEAIHVVQVQMGIAGTTALEASETISGSLGSLQAAWENMIVGFAQGDADIGELITNVVDSAITVVNNVIPVAEQAILGIGEFVTQLAPVITEKIPTIVQNVLPSILQAASSLLSAAVSAIIESLPMIVSAGIDLVESLAKSLSDNVSLIISTVTTILSTIVTTIIDSLPEIIELGLNLGESLAEGLSENLPAIIDAITTIIQKLFEFITEKYPEILQLGFSMIQNMAQGFIDNLPSVMQSISDIIMSVVDFLTSDGLQDMLSMGIELIFSLAQGLIENLPTIISAIAQVLAQLLAYILENLPEFIQMGIELIGQIIIGLIDAIPDIIAALPQIFEAIINAFAEVDWLEIGSNIIDGIVSGIGGAVSRLWEAAVNAAKAALSKIKNVLGISSPSKVFRDQVGEMIPEGMAIGIEANTDAVEDAMQDLADITTDPFANMGNVISLDENQGDGSVHGGIVINVYPREGQSEEEIAEYVMDKLNMEYAREARALA